MKSPLSLLKRNPLRLFLAMLSLPMVSMYLFTGCKRIDDGILPEPALSIIADNIASPLGVLEAPDNSKRLFIIDQTGKIWIVNANGSKNATPFIDVTSKMVTLNPAYDERGLLGMAFHPAFQSNGKFYLFYTAPPRAGGPEPGVNWNNLTRISEFKVATGNPDVADISSERIILEADHPQSNHNGGTIAFGPDGYLYIAIGDGGGANDVGPGHVTDWYAVNRGGNAQNIHANLMGKILRIDVNSGSPYSIPADNPFFGTSAKGEIYAYGFRNPYRFSFDMVTGALYAGDAGQKLFEEIDVVTKGGNYGWNIKEGTVCFNTDSNLLIRPSCPSADSMGNALIPPIIELKNFAHPAGGGLATVVVGGNVYRGTSLPQYHGRYIFGTFSSAPQQLNGRLYVAQGTSGGFEEIPITPAGHLGLYLKGFGQDLSGEIYITTSEQAGVSGTTGKVYKIVGAL